MWAQIISKILLVEWRKEELTLSPHSSLSCLLGKLLSIVIFCGWRRIQQATMHHCQWRENKDHMILYKVQGRPSGVRRRQTPFEGSPRVQGRIGCSLAWRAKHLAFLVRMMQNLSLCVVLKIEEMFLGWNHSVLVE